MSSGPLQVGFDEVHSVPDAGPLRVELGRQNRDRPVWTYWVPLLCALFPDSMRAAPVAVLASGRVPFVYPVELRFEADEWHANTPENELLAVLPPEVEQASAAGRVVVVLSIAHEGRPLFEQGGHSRPTLLDRVAAFGRWYALPRERLWFVSGNLDGDGEVGAWMRARNLARLPFTFRACEPFSAFVGGCAAQSLLCGRGPSAMAAFQRQGPHAIGWQGTTVERVPLPFPGASLVQSTTPQFRYACLNRMFRRHRWEVLDRLWRADVLGRGLVSFPRPDPEMMRFEGVDATGPDASELLQMLPLTIDKPARFDDAGFFSDNSAFVGLHPSVVLRECAMELVTETRQEGCRFVSEKTFKALLGRGPAVVVGTSGVLAYLHSLGVRTWSDKIAEQYDCIPYADQRLAAAMDSALEYISRSGSDDPGLAEVREANLRWLVSAPKPWDRLVGELCDTVRWLG